MVPNRTGPDTLFVIRNDFRHNLYIDVLRKRGSVEGLLTPDFSSSACSEFFNTRFPPPPGLHRNEDGPPFEMVITYPLVSRGFKPTFLNDSIALSVFIYDREGNRSNVMKTPFFTLPSLLRDP